MDINKKDEFVMTDGPGMAYDPNRRSPMEEMSKGTMGMNMFMAQNMMPMHTDASLTASETKVIDNKCGKCGKEVAENAKFCGGCGAKLIRE